MGDTYDSTIYTTYLRTYSCLLTIDYVLVVVIKLFLQKCLQVFHDQLFHTRSNDDIYIYISNTILDVNSTPYPHGTIEICTGPTTIDKQKCCISCTIVLVNAYIIHMYFTGPG